MRRRRFVTRTAWYTSAMVALLFCGQSRAATHVGVYARASGRLAAVLVRPGDRVSAGQLVAMLDDAPFTTELKAAESALRHARAERDASTKMLERMKDLYQRGTVPQRELDAAQEMADRAVKADAEALARVQRARQKLERAQVKSPVTGTVTQVSKQAGDAVDGTPNTQILEVTR